MFCANRRWQMAEHLTFNSPAWWKWPGCVLSSQVDAKMREMAPKPGYRQYFPVMYRHVFENPIVDTLPCIFQDFGLQGIHSLYTWWPSLNHSFPMHLPPGWLESPGKLPRVRIREVSAVEKGVEQVPAFTLTSSLDLSSACPTKPSLATMFFWKLYTFLLSFSKKTTDRNWKNVRKKKPMVHRMKQTLTKFHPWKSLAVLFQLV